MKKQIAIFSFLVFFLAQFGKVINFCFCKVEAYQQTKNFICDCEKQLYTAVKTDNTAKDQSPQNISSQQSTEELFYFLNLSSFTINHVVCFTAWPKPDSEGLYHIFGKNVFHPPLRIS
ncbi:MAG TPA: hypothetical protein VK645_05025 [Chitinophagaceae bacterium]|nr:hypothetical protein [Chitinophagaceae bacterium]